MTIPGDAQAVVADRRRAQRLVLRNLADAGLLIGRSIHLDLLKVPHHGSARNVTRGFFDMVTADHYVILTDGTNGNPDIGMLKMLTDARGSDRYTISLTNREFRLVAFFAEDRVQHTRRYGVRFRSPTALSIAVDLEAGS